jgi:hypothetical protein
MEGGIEMINGEREEKGRWMAELGRDRDRGMNSAPLLPFCHFTEIPLKKLFPGSSLHHHVSLKL